MYTECETCGETVEAEITHNGVRMVGHYVHCGWGHQCAPEDLRDTSAKEREHAESADCWCSPPLDYVDPETGVAVYVHHEAN